jgi:hypothetical protein
LKFGEEKHYKYLEMENNYNLLRKNMQMDKALKENSERNDASVLYFEICKR